MDRNFDRIKSLASRDERASLLRRGSSGLLLDAVLRAALLTTVDAEAVKRATHNVVTHTRKIAHTTTAHEHDGVLLQVVAFATDVGRDFLAVRETHAANLTKRRVRLLRGHGANLKANAATLRARAEVLDLGLGGLHNAWLTNELINRGHAVTRELLKVGSTSVPTAVTRRKVFVRDETEATKELAKGRETCGVPRSAILVDNRDSKSIASLILRMPDVTAHPLRLDAMDRTQSIELLPELDVQHWPLFPAPTASLPTVHPFIEALHEILRIAHEAHGGRSFQPLQALDRSEKFHAIVCRRALAASALGFNARNPQDKAPTSRTRIA